MEMTRRPGSDRRAIAPHRDPRTSIVAEWGFNRSDAPIGRNLVVLVQSALALAIAPVELAARPVGRGLAQLLVGKIELVGFERRVVTQRIPGQRMIFLTHAQKAAEPHHRIGNLAADLVDHHALDLADLLAVGATHGRSFDPVARNQAVVSGFRFQCCCTHRALPCARSSKVKAPSVAEVPRRAAGLEAGGCHVVARRRVVSANPARAVTGLAEAAPVRWRLDTPATRGHEAADSPKAGAATHEIADSPLLHLVERSDVRNPGLDLALWRTGRRGRIRQSLLSDAWREDRPVAGLRATLGDLQRLCRSLAGAAELARLAG